MHPYMRPYTHESDKLKAYSEYAREISYTTHGCICLWINQVTFIGIYRPEMEQQAMELKVAVAQTSNRMETGKT